MREAWVEFRLQKGEEEVEEVDAETVRDDVPTSGENYTKEEQEEEYAGADPAVGDIRRGFVEVGLVLLRMLLDCW
jgi:hypothetical protein